MKFAPLNSESMERTNEAVESRAETESLHSISSLRSYCASTLADDGLPAYTDEPSTPLTPGTSTTGYSETPRNPDIHAGGIGPAQPSTTYTNASSNVTRPVWFSDSRGAGLRAPASTLERDLTCDPERLRDLLLDEARIAPRPFVLFEGEHNESRDDNGKTETRTVTDFKVLVDCSEVFDSHSNQSPNNAAPWYELHTVPDYVKAHRGGVFATRAKASANAFHDLERPGPVSSPSTTYSDQALRAWCHIYCSKVDQSIFPYTLTLRRRITEWATTHIEIELTRMIRQTNYRGRIRVTFAVEDSTFTVYSPHWMNRARTNNYIWWICVVLFLWILTWPVLWLCTGRFEVLHVIWPYKKPDPRDPTQPIYARYSEQRWLDTWGQAVIDAAFARRQQTLTAQDLARVMALQERRSRASMPFNSLVSTENQIPDWDSSLYHRTTNMRSEQDLARGWGADDDAGWWSTTRYNLTRRSVPK